MTESYSPVSDYIRNPFPRTEFSRWRALLAPLLLLLLAACATPRNIAPPQRFLDAGGAHAECARFLSTLDGRIAAVGVADVQAARFQYYPYLRVNRFLAAMAPATAASKKFSTWIDELRALALEARQIEIANLPKGEVPVPRIELLREAERCGDLMAAELQSPVQREHLLAQVYVPDDYSLTLRVFGLYPLSSLFFKAGVTSLHRSFREDFERPLAAQHPKGHWRRYGPPTAPPSLTPASVSHLLADARSNALGVYHFDESKLAVLYTHFAPVWEVDTVSADDQMGKLTWDAGQHPLVDTGSPVVFRHLSQTLFEGEVLLQLNYMIWFPARPRTGPLDLLGGHMDGIVWRVTLDRRGVPLVYDSMHLCGCYHLFFPTAQLRQRPPSSEVHEEPIFVPQKVTESVGVRTIIRIAAHTHYLRKIYSEKQVGSDVIYGWENYRSLRSLPLPGGGHRSLFGPDALVAGSERRERWLFWPMGIVSPGAMRQWGHHATAFVGRRHFDEAGLIGRYFERVR